MIKILVTGVAGYIGSVVTEQLVIDGYEVVGVDNFQEGKRESVNRYIDFVEGNFGDTALLRHIFGENKIDTVFHFAAETTIDFCMTDPAKYFNNNVVNGLNLLNVMREFNCNKLIFSSTAATFGEPKYSPIDEVHPQIPINSYGESKLMFEKILDWYNYAYGLKFNLFRYFNAAGATENFGENRAHETHLLPIIVESVLKSNQKLKVFGNDYPTRDGTCIRDYVHVIDIAQGHLKALSNIDKNPRGKYNLGSGSGFSVLEVIEMAGEVAGKKIAYEVTDKRDGDPAVLVASNELAKKELGWRPELSNLRRIVEDTFKWIEKRK